MQYGVLDGGEVALGDGQNAVAVRCAGDDIAAAADGHALDGKVTLGELELAVAVHLNLGDELAGGEVEDVVGRSADAHNGTSEVLLHHNEVGEHGLNGGGGVQTGGCGQRKVLLGDEVVVHLHRGGSADELTAGAELLAFLDGSLCRGQVALEADVRNVGGQLRADEAVDVEVVAVVQFRERTTLIEDDVLLGGTPRYYGQHVTHAGQRAVLGEAVGGVHAGIRGGAERGEV